MAKKSKKHTRDTDGMVYSTNENFDFSPFAALGDHLETASNDQQELRVMIDKKKRAGKKVTLVTGFEGSDDDLKDLAKELKSACGVGGSAKEGEIIIQGDFKDKVFDLLIAKSYKVKKVGG